MEENSTKYSGIYIVAFLTCSSTYFDPFVELNFDATQKEPIFYLKPPNVHAYLHKKIPILRCIEKWLLCKERKEKVYTMKN